MKLYRLFNADEQLIYVGISLHAIQRATEHKAGKAWWPLVARMEFEDLGDASRREAEAREREVITDEQPLYNIAHRPNPTSARSVRQALRCVVCGKQVTSGYVVIHDFESARSTPKCNLRRCSGADHIPTIAEMVDQTEVDPCLAVWRPCYTAIVTEQFAHFAQLLERGDLTSWHAEHGSKACTTLRPIAAAVMDVQDALLIIAGKQPAARHPLAPFRRLHPDEPLPADPSTTGLLPWPALVDELDP